MADAGPTACNAANNATPSSQPRTGTRIRLLDLSDGIVEDIILRHLDPSALSNARATCRTLKRIADSAVSGMVISHESLCSHGFLATATLPSVTSLTLDLAARPAIPLYRLLPPVALAGLRNRFSGLQHLTLRNALLEAPRPEPRTSRPPRQPASQPRAPPAGYPLDLVGLLGLRIEGMDPENGDGSQLNYHRLRPFPSGLGPSLVRAAPSLTSLHLSRVAFCGSDGDVLGSLTGLRELSIKDCYNATARGLTRLGELTGLTSLEYENVRYKTGIPMELAVLSALTRLCRVNFRRSDLYPHEIAAWSAWAPTLTRLELSSDWQMTVDAAPDLVRRLTSLVELDLASHALDLPMWDLLVRHLPRLEAARFRWLTMGEDDLLEGGAEVADAAGAPAVAGGAAAGAQPGAGAGQPGALAGVQEPQQQPDGGGAGAGGGYGGGGGGGAGGGQPAGPRLRPHTGLRRLQLDLPADEEEGLPLWPLLPGLQELRVADDVDALDDLEAKHDANAVYFLTILPCEYPDTSPAAKLLCGHEHGGAERLTALSIPAAWLPFLLSTRGCRNLRTLTLHSVIFTGGGRNGSRRRWDAGEPLASKYRMGLQEAWRGFNPPERPFWPHLTRLEVPRKEDAQALAHLCPAGLQVVVTEQL